MPTISTFRRSADDAKLAGVCGGVAGRWGLDPVLVRVVFVLLALTGGVGVVLYLAGWLLLPVAGAERAVVDDLLGGAAARWPRELWITLIVLACLVAFGVFGAISPFGIAPALALLALWWFGFHRPRARRSRAVRAARPAVAPGSSGGTPAPPTTWSGPATPFTQAALAWQARVREVRTGVRSPAPPWSGPSAPVPPAQPTVDPEELARAAFLAAPDPVGLYTEPVPEPVAVVRAGTSLSARRLRLVTVSALGLTWAGLGVADAQGVPVSLAVYAGAGLLVLGLGLVAATRWGRAPGLLPAGVVLALAAVVVSGLLGPTLSGPTARATAAFDHPVAYTDAGAFPVDGDRLDTGDLQVDLTGLTLVSDVTYRAVVDTGRIVVRTPPGTGVALHFDVDTGDVQAYGHHLGSGSDLEGDRLVVAPAAGQHTLTLDLRLDTGVVEVRS